MAKPFLTYDQQLDKLINGKKLCITDCEKAKEILRDIGYFSLIGGYKTPFINPMTRVYEDNTALEDIYALYQFDLALRELVFKYLCQIESCGSLSHIVFVIYMERHRPLTLILPIIITAPKIWMR